MDHIAYIMFHPHQMSLHGRRSTENSIIHTPTHHELTDFDETPLD